MYAKYLVVLGLVLVGVFGAAGDAMAWYGSYGCDGYGWWGAYYGLRQHYAPETRPYFAVYPPVYYSRPVARTYGEFPYPYFEAQAKVAPAPVTIQNPYVVQVAEESGSKPLRILNPYVVQSADSSIATPPKKMSLSAELPEEIPKPQPAAEPELAFPPAVGGVQ